MCISSSVVLLIYKLSLVLYSVGSGVKNVRVVCLSWVWSCLLWSQRGCRIGMIACVLLLSVCCNDCDVVCMGYELCVFKKSRYVWGVYVESVVNKTHSCGTPFGVVWMLCFRNRISLRPLIYLVLCMLECMSLLISLCIISATHTFVMPSATVIVFTLPETFLFRRWHY